MSTGLLGGIVCASDAEFLQGEKPEMRIFVQDNSYIEFNLPNE